MKRPLARAAALLLAALIVAGGVLALRPVEPTGPAYTVAQITMGLRQHPRRWANRTVLVRGVAMGISIGLGTGARSGGTFWQRTLLLDQNFFPQSRQQRVPPIVQQTPAGRVLLNTPKMAPTLLLRGVRPLGRSPLDGVAQWVALNVARLRGEVRRSNTYTVPNAPAPRVYRVQLVAPMRCTPPLVAPCYTAAVR